MGWICNSEKFPSPGDIHWSRWQALWSAHGMEVRNRPLAIEHGRYQQIERDQRLVWIVARDENNGPIGYSCHWTYREMAFGDTVGADGIWYTAPAWRKQGVGRRTKEMGLLQLKEMGAEATYDHIREGGPDLSRLGYEKWGERWKRNL